MTKEDFLIVSDLLTGYDFGELDKVEFFMGYERKSNTEIPEEWFSEAELKEFETQPDWSSFRREAAKDILCAIIISDTARTYGEKCSLAMTVSDELIKQLKEDEKP